MKGSTMVELVPEVPSHTSERSRRRTHKSSERTAKEIFEVDVVEVYSPPRVTAMASKLGPQAGDTMDLITAWDSTKEEYRER